MMTCMCSTLEIENPVKGKQEHQTPEACPAGVIAILKATGVPSDHKVEPSHLYLITRVIRV